MYDLFQTVLLLSLLGGGLGLILLCLKPFLVRTVPPRWQTWIWAAVLLSMVLPVYKLVPAPAPVPSMPLILPQEEPESPTVTPQTEQEETNTQTISPTPQPMESEPPQPQRLTLAHLGYLWLAGAGAFLALLLGSYGRFRFQLLKKSISISEHPLLEEVQKELGIRRFIPLRAVPGLPSPMLVGIFFPVVCLPDPNLSEGHLRMILLHELTHYKRKDLLLKWLALLVNAVHWFNPLAYLLTRNLGQACEDACDRDVTRDMTLQERKLYMSTILALAQA